jgi:hypothetical protein
MKKLTLLFAFAVCIQLCAGIFVNAQTSNNTACNNFMFSIGAGTATLPSFFYGYSLYSSFSFERKHNEFSLRWNFNRQYGNRVPSFILSQPCNDKFRDFALLYGRTFRKNIFFTSASLGLGYYKYTNRWVETVVPPSNSWVSDSYVIKEKIIKNIGIATQAEILFIIDDNTGIGLSFFGNINKDKSIVGLSLNLVYGILNCDQ